MNNNISVPVSIGELFDKVSVLRIKVRRIHNAEKVFQAQAELDALAPLIPDDAERYLRDMEDVNEIIWDAIDQQWAMVRGDVSGSTEDFATLARKVLVENDRRFEIKRRVNLAYGSALHEVKQYSGRT